MFSKKEKNCRGSYQSNVSWTFVYGTDVLDLILGNLPIFRKKNGCLAATYACLRILKQNLGLEAARLRVLHTSINEIIDSVVIGSDPPLACSAHATAGDAWRAPTRLPLKPQLAAGVWKTETKKLSIVSQCVKSRILIMLEGRPHDNACRLSRPEAWIKINGLTLSPTYIHVPVSETKRAGCWLPLISRSNLNRGSWSKLTLRLDEKTGELGRKTKSRPRNV